MNGLVVAEHLAALLIVALIVGWLTLLARVYQQTVLPKRLAATAYYAANVALVTHDPTVVVGQTTWQVSITTTRIEVVGNGQTYTFTPGHDHD